MRTGHKGNSIVKSNYLSICKAFIIINESKGIQNMHAADLFVIIFIRIKQMYRYFHDMSLKFLRIFGNFKLKASPH